MNINHELYQSISYERRTHTVLTHTYSSINIWMNTLVQYVFLFRNTQISISHSLFFTPSLTLSEFSMKCSVIILLQFSMQAIIIAVLAHLFCQSEKDGEGQLTPNTHPFSATPTPSQTYMCTHQQTLKHSHTCATQGNRQPRRAETHICRKASSPG